MRRIPPYIDCILQYYLMETYGQVACTARTRGTIGGHRRRSGCVVQPDIGDLRSGRVLGLETGTIKRAQAARSGGH